MTKRPNKGPAPPKDLFALGTKVKPDSELKTSFGLKKPVSGSTSGPSLKRDRDQVAGSSSDATQAAKRSRLGSGALQTLGRPSDSLENKFAPAMHLYEDRAIEVEGVKLVEQVMKSLNDVERVEGLLCGAVKNLKLCKSKPEEAMYIGVMYLAKARPEIFQSEVVIEAFCSLLKKETNPNLKLKVNNLLPVVACNIFALTLQDKTSWPDSFVKAYIDDSLGDRVWVDQTECRTFVENVLTAFGTKLPKNNFQADRGAKPDNPVQLNDNEEATNFIEEAAAGPTMERYVYQLSTIEPFVMDVIRDQLSRRRPLDGGSINLVRTLTFLCGLSEIRALVVQRLDIWLQSPKLMKVAQDLLMSICINFNPKKYPQDLELINSLCMIRFKTKNLSSYFNLCLKELLAQNGENLPLLLQHVVTCELTNARNQNNLNFLNVMLQNSPEEVIKLLAEAILGRLMVREDHLKPLRVLLREIMRFSKADFKLGAFVYNLLRDVSQTRFRDLDPLVKERYVTSVIDLVSMTMLLSANNSVREAASNPRADVKDIEILREFQNQVSVLQRDAIWWLRSVVIKMLQIKSSDYMLCLRKVLFVEKPEAYSRVDNWPPESDRGSLLKLVSEVPLQEDMLLCIVLMGHNKELHLSIPELIELLEVIIRRAASIYSEDFHVLKIENTDFMGALLNLCAYRHPENSLLPKGYKPPNLAIMSFYWKAWQILLILSAFNPNTIGLKAWECYPTLKCLMEMAMTNNFSFPPVTMAFDEASAEEIKSQEMQMVEYFKQQTLELECHLAGSVITETNSRLLPQVCRMELEGFLLKPPQSVLDSVRILNQSLSLGKLLCRSREPADFLLNIIQRQGTSQSMPWLKDLVESNDSSLEVLPVQCLCEFLLHDIHADSGNAKGCTEKKHQKNLKQEQLLARLQNLVRSPSNEPKVMDLINQSLSYFFERLSFSQSYSRRQATKCLSHILVRSLQEEDGDKSEETLKVNSGCNEILKSYQWLFEGLTSLSHFEAIKMQIFVYIRAACQVETNITAISAYVVFLSHHSNSLNLQELDDLVLDIAQLILERVSLVSCLLQREQNDASAEKDSRLNLVLSSLLDLFYCHLSKARQPRNETYSWSNNQYQILLHWSSGQSAKMNILIVHATVIVLACGPPEGESHFDELMDAWFPQNEQPPTAYLIDTSEEALLIPDWLKLRMIRSNVPRLIDASFGDAEVPQLLLFIQSFGISVRSMNKLLQHLDSNFENNKSELLRLVLDKNYMAELIEVQHLRGATGGERFYKMLTGDQQQKAESKQGLLPEERLMDFLEPFIMVNEFTPKHETSVKNEESSSNEIFEVLTKLFLEPEISKVEKSGALRILYRAAGCSTGLTNLVESCTKLICSPSGTTFMDSLLKNTTYSCPLFKQIISSCHTKVSEDLCEVILSRSVNPKNQLSYMLRQHLGKLGGTSSLLRRSFVVHQSISGVKEEMKDEKNELVTEEQVRNALEDMVEQPSKVKDIVKVLVPFTKQFDNLSSTTKNLYRLHDTTKNTLYSGLVLDSIELFNPQIIQHDLLRELLEILFKSEIETKQEPAEICCPKSPTCGDDEDMEVMEEKFHKATEFIQSQNNYLLCLLLHRCGWSNLIQIINSLLPKNASNFSERYDSSTILDFIEACFNVSNLWLSRDKRISKHQPIEDILSLSLNQVSCLVAMTVNEQLKKERTNSSPGVDKVASRLNLIESCCAGKISKLKAVVETLCLMQETQDIEVISIFLWGMYLRVPKVFVEVKHKLRLTERSMERLFTDESQFDIGTQRMMTCLLDVNLSSGRMDEERLLHSTMVSRKMASQHPIIFLRQLPLLSSFLEGHAQFLCAEVKVRSLSPMFMNVLGILYLLQPYIFHSIHSAKFHSIIDSFAQIISVYGFSTRHHNGLIKKFLEIIFNYFNHCPTQAYLCLKKHLPLLRRLDKQYEDFRTFQRFLLRLICFDEAMERKLSSKDNMNSESIKKSASVKKNSRTSYNELFSFTFNKGKCQPGTLAVKATPIWEVSKFFTLVQKTDRLYVQTTTELIEGLKELDEISRVQVDILGEFTDNIENLMLDDNSDCREAGYALMMRLLRYNPKVGRVFCPSLKKCLADGDLHIVQSALDSLKEFTVLAQEHAAELLVHAFKAGLAWSLDVSPYINETLQILNLRLITPS